MRFALEAGFIVLVGVIAAVLDLSLVGIVVVMGLAWVVVAVVERAAKGITATPRRPRERVREQPVEAPMQAVYGDEPATPEQPEPRRRQRFFESGGVVDPGAATRE
jgi:hypothetical protein